VTVQHVMHLNCSNAAALTDVSSHHTFSATVMMTVVTPLTNQSTAVSK